MSRTSYLNVNLNDKNIMDDFRKTMLNHLNSSEKKLQRISFLQSELQRSNQRDRKGCNS
jgi:hypothetical protein